MDPLLPRMYASHNSVVGLAYRYGRDGAISAFDAIIPIRTFASTGQTMS